MSDTRLYTRSTGAPRTEPPHVGVPIWSAVVHSASVGASCYLQDASGLLRKSRQQLTASAAVRVVLRWAQDSLTGAELQAAEAALRPLIEQYPAPASATPFVFLSPPTLGGSAL